MKIFIPKNTVKYFSQVLTVLNADDLITIEKELQIKLSTIREELQKLIIDRDSVRTELRTIIEELNSKRNKLKNLREELKNVREELNSLYNALNEVKKTLGELREKLSANIHQAKQLSAKLKKISTMSSKESIDNIREEIERLEWILITTPNLTIDEEKGIIDRISQLEKKLREISLHQKDSIELYSQYRELVDNINNLKKELKDKVNMLNNIREKIKQLKEVRDHLKNEIANIANTIIELKRRRENLKNRLTEIISAIESKNKEYKETIKELNRLRERKERDKLNAIVSRRKEEIRSRIERGERVSFYELYLAFSSDEKESIQQ